MPGQNRRNFEKKTLILNSNLRFQLFLALLESNMVEGAITGSL